MWKRKRLENHHFHIPVSYAIKYSSKHPLKFFFLFPHISGHMTYISCICIIMASTKSGHSHRCTKSKILNPTPNPNPTNANPNSTPTPKKSKFSIFASDAQEYLSIPTNAIN